MKLIISSHLDKYCNQYVLITQDVNFGGEY